jgi:hypothetical protein
LFIIAGQIHEKPSSEIPSPLALHRARTQFMYSIDGERGKYMLMVSIHATLLRNSSRRFFGFLLRLYQNRTQGKRLALACASKQYFAE